jgi:hypothetical protein
MDRDTSPEQVPGAFPLKKNVRAWVMHDHGLARTKSYHLSKGTLVRPCRSPAHIPLLDCEVRVIVGGRDRRVYVNARDFLPLDLLLPVEARDREASRRAIEITRRIRGVELPDPTDQSESPGS